MQSIKYHNQVCKTISVEEFFPKEIYVFSLHLV